MIAIDATLLVFFLLDHRLIFFKNPQGIFNLKSGTSRREAIETTSYHRYDPTLEPYGIFKVIFHNSSKDIFDLLRKMQSKEFGLSTADPNPTPERPHTCAICYQVSGTYALLFKILVQNVNTLSRDGHVIVFLFFFLVFIRTGRKLWVRNNNDCEKVISIIIF